MEEKQEIKNEQFPMDWEKDDKKIYRFKEKNRLPKTVQSEIDRYLGINGTNLVSIKEGDTISGEIIQINKKQIIVDFKYKDYIYCNFTMDEIKMLDGLKIGQMVDVLIVEVKENPYVLIGSITELIREKTHKFIEESYKNNTVVCGKVESMTPSGFIVNIQKNGVDVKCFMPNTLADVNKLSQPENLIGQNIEAFVESLKVDDRGLEVLNRKRYLLSLIPEKLKNIKIGQIHSGIVTGIIESGIFIQFESILTAFLHKSMLNKQFSDDIKTKVLLGMIIYFIILDVTRYGKIFATQYANIKPI